MTINKKQVKVEYVETSTTSVTCDFCGRTFNHAFDRDDKIEWEAGVEYSVLDSAMFYRKGHESREGGVYKEVAYHVCPRCMADKVFPAIAHLAKTGPHVTEVDW